MTHASNARLSVIADAASDCELSVVPHEGGWAIKHRDSILGAMASLADALCVMATLADHTTGRSRASGGHRLRSV